VIDDHDVAGQLIGFLEVLGGEQDIGAAGDEIADRTPQLHAAARVQAGGRLVEQQELGAADQAGAEVQPPAHSSRVGAYQAVPGIREVQCLQDGSRGRPRAAAVEAEEAADELQVLPAGHGRLDRS